MSEAAQTRMWLAQRISAGVLGVSVVVHLAGIVTAVQGGLTAAEIIDRVGGNGVMALFYGVFVIACAVHAPIGIRTVLSEMTNFKPASVSGIAITLAALIVMLGLKAVLGLYGLGRG